MNGDISITKGCVPKCSNYTSGDSRNGVIRSCCDKDLCNIDLTHRQLVATPHKLDEPLKCYSCKNCGEDNLALIEECPAVSDYYCSVS